MKIEIIFEDEDLIVVNKPAGVLVHPTLAKEKDTLVDWLVDKYPDIKNLNWSDATRPGIVHRLDKNTSGLIILAKRPEILEKLQQQFKERKIQKTYTALAWGKVIPVEGKIETLIVRGKAGTQQVREFNFSISNETLRPAITFYKTISQHKFKNNDLTLLSVMPKTGRMHQIRTHLKYIGHPIIGDPLYHTKLSKKISQELGISRQFLHATKLEFLDLNFQSDLPKDLKNIKLKI